MAKRTRKVETLIHREATRRNIPTAEYQPVMHAYDRDPIRVAYERRNPDRDPQLVWRGKDMEDWSDLVVPTPPLFIQEKVHPKVLIDDLERMSRRAREEGIGDRGGQAVQPDLFGDFNGLPDGDARTEFYRHDANWSNRMVLGDSLQVMASLAERERLRGKVQCIYIDPPYGIRFNSNFQWSTTSRDVRDGKADHITREPEQVKAFRDTWRDGIHSYLTYLRDRLTVARELLTESGSVFVQIGDENVHRVRALMDEVFGEHNAVAQIAFAKTSSATSRFVPSTFDSLLWYSRDISCCKFRRLFRVKSHETTGASEYVYVREPGATAIRRLSPAELADTEVAADFLRIDNLTSQSGGVTTRFPYVLWGESFAPGSGGWKTNATGMTRLEKANRLYVRSTSMNYVRFLQDHGVLPLGNIWEDTAIAGWSEYKVYVVQTARRVIQRCILMTTDPGDLVLDPTCGSGTTAYVAEQWGRRWITIDTSRVALALARARIMGARHPWYLLADSREGQVKEAALARRAPSEAPAYNDIRHGFVYERVPHITLKSIANNAEIDVIHERLQPEVESALSDLNRALQGHAAPFVVQAGGRKGQEIDFGAPAGSTVDLPSGESAPANGLLEWEVPREPGDGWTGPARAAHERFWKARIARQHEIDACIAASAEYEHLYDRPFQDNRKVRVAGPFTVESVSPHRLAALDEQDELMVAEPRASRLSGAEVCRHEFAHVILENLRTAGVQQARKADRITFSSLEPWPGELVCAEGRYDDGDGREQRAGVFIGPEFGTVSRPDLVSATREAADAGFDILIACAFNFEVHATEFTKLGRVPVLKARMNADLHMADDFRKTDTANLFVIFGEPDIDIETATGPGGETDWRQVRIKGVDVFDPAAGEVRSDGPEGIACWFVDTDYNEESFFVRQAYFPSAGDPYKSIRTTLKAEIDADAWATLHSDTSRPFPKPASGRIAVKVINHLGDEVMKVFRV